MRKLIGFLLGVFAALLVAAALGEILLRLLMPQQEAMRWFESSARYGFVNKKNFQQSYRYVSSDYVMDVRTNSVGFRDDEIELGLFMIPGKKRIIFIGDSFTFGYGVALQERFDKLLINMLSETDHSFMSANLGVGGWGTLQATRYLIDHLDVFKPDVVVLTFCSNDPDDDELYELGLHDSAAGIYKIPGRVFLRNNSHLYRFLYYRFRVGLHRVALLTAGRADGDTLATLLGVPRMLVDERYRARVVRYIEKTDYGATITQAQWSKTAEHVREFRRALKRKNENSLLIIQASSPWDDLERSHLSKLHNGDDIIFVDLYDQSMQLTKPQRRTPHDGHWSPAMHWISARALYDAVRGKL